MMNLQVDSSTKIGILEGLMNAKTRSIKTEERCRQRYLQRQKAMRQTYSEEDWDSSFEMTDHQSLSSPNFILKSRKFESYRRRKNENISRQ